MVDGVSADHYLADAGRFPNFRALEQQGFRVERLHAEVLGTSLPGRTSMMTGVTANVSGVYGNLIWGGDSFRYANPDDIRVPTLPALAKAAGKSVAVVGFGMIRPEDTDVFKPPWWITEFVKRARDSTPTLADEVWMRVYDHPVNPRFEQICESAGIPSYYPEPIIENGNFSDLYGFMADQQVADWVGVLAASKSPPDLIIAEFLVTDNMQHDMGYRSDAAQYAVRAADLALGSIRNRLRTAGGENDWNIAVMSDHGHGPVDQAIHPNIVVPGITAQCEGGSLLVATEDENELQTIGKSLAKFDVQPYPNDCIPPDLRHKIHVFMAPERTSFEMARSEDEDPVGPPRALSTHGMFPGYPSDDRFALFAGPDVPFGRAFEADATQVAPTFASILNIPLDSFPSLPIFDPVGHDHE